MSDAPTALITGINGQDGSFLAELLLEKGYEVTGWSRAGDSRPLGPSEPLRDRLTLRGGELLDRESLRAAVLEVRPDEIYHLAAPSFVPASWDDPAETLIAIAGSSAAVLQAVREAELPSRVFVAASGSIFGDAPESPQTELTPCRPNNPYAIAKLAAHELLGAMRRRDGLHASSGIVFNHESERRPVQFVSRRISRAAAAIALGLESDVTLGSLDAVRDWSFAGDVMRGAWLMLQQEQPGDYVLASGIPHTVAELAEIAFASVDLEAERHIHIDETLIRGPELTINLGDPTLAQEVLGWRPELDFAQLVERMVRADMRELEATAQKR